MAKRHRPQGIPGWVIVLAIVGPIALVLFCMLSITLLGKNANRALSGTPQTVQLGKWQFVMPNPAKKQPLPGLDTPHDCHVSMLRSCAHFAVKLNMELPKNLSKADYAKVIDNVRDSMTNNAGQLQRETPCDLGSGSIGREFAYVENKSQHYVRLRIWLHEGFMYLAMVENLGKDNAECERLADQFFQKISHAP